MCMWLLLKVSMQLSVSFLYWEVVSVFLLRPRPSLPRLLPLCPPLIIFPSSPPLLSLPHAAPAHRLLSGWAVLPFTEMPHLQVGDPHGADHTEHDKEHASNHGGRDGGKRRPDLPKHAHQEQHTARCDNHHPAPDLHTQRRGIGAPGQEEALEICPCVLHTAAVNPRSSTACCSQAPTLA